MLGNVSENFSSSGADTKNQRVIFYSNDVRESGQRLNFDNKRMYGPIKYEGGNIDVSFSILELDENENKNVKAMLSALADFGKKAYVPLAPALSIISSLGDALLKSNTDDLELAYTFSFDPSPESKNIHPSKIERFEFREGFYVIRREEVRSTDTPWHETCFNRNIGMPVECGSTTSTTPTSTAWKTPSNQIDRTQTWLVFRVLREPDSAAQANNNLKSFEELRNALEAGNKFNDEAAFKTITDALGGMFSKSESQNKSTK